MKSEERHRLETNVVADRLAVWIDRLRPYATSVAGIVLFVLIAMFAWSYMTGASSAWQNEAWDAYNEAVVSPMPNLELLRHSAEEHQGTKMQQLADITWADGQVWLAARDYLYNKAGVTAALTNATTAYQSILSSTDDERMKNRARLGMARVYEMQNELEKAGAEYEKVTGGYANFAKERAKQLGEKKVQDVYAWLATATPPRRPSPVGPGTPGKTPGFSVNDMPLPGEAPATGTPGTGGTAVPGPAFDSLLQGFDPTKAATDGADRYGDGKSAPAAEQPAGDLGLPTTSTESAPADGKSDAEAPKK